MECNLGHKESRIRIGLGVLLLGIAGLTMLPGWGTVLAFVVGFVAIFTGIGRFCPLWKLLRINTCQDHRAESH